MTICPVCQENPVPDNFYWKTCEACHAANGPYRDCRDCGEFKGSSGFGGPEAARRRCLACVARGGTGMDPCPRCERLRSRDAFTEGDAYCRDCRQDYNRTYYEKNSGYWRDREAKRVARFSDRLETTLDLEAKLHAEREETHRLRVELSRVKGELDQIKRIQNGTEKVCGTCDRARPLHCYQKNGRDRNGKQRYLSTCNICTAKST